jgi:hypothetical protein
MRPFTLSIVAAARNGSRPVEIRNQLGSAQVVPRTKAQKAGSSPSGAKGSAALELAFGSARFTRVGSNSTSNWNAASPGSGTPVTFTWRRVTSPTFRVFAIGSIAITIDPWLWVPAAPGTRHARAATKKPTV